MFLLDENWDTACPRLNMKSLKVTLTQYMEVCGDNLKGKKKDETVVKTKKICQVSYIIIYIYFLTLNLVLHAVPLCVDSTNKYRLLNNHIQY